MLGTRLYTGPPNHTVTHSNVANDNALSVHVTCGSFTLSTLQSASIHYLTSNGVGSEYLKVYKYRHNDRFLKSDEDL